MIDRVQEQRQAQLTQGLINVGSQGASQKKPPAAAGTSSGSSASAASAAPSGTSASSQVKPNGGIASWPFIGSLFGKPDFSSVQAKSQAALSALTTLLDKREEFIASHRLDTSSPVGKINMMRLNRMNSQIEKLTTKLSGERAGQEAEKIGGPSSQDTDVGKFNGLQREALKREVCRNVNSPSRTMSRARYAAINEHQLAGGEIPIPPTANGRPLNHKQAGACDDDFSKLRKSHGDPNSGNYRLPPLEPKDISDKTLDAYMRKISTPEE